MQSAVLESGRVPEKLPQAFPTRAWRRASRWLAGIGGFLVFVGLLLIAAGMFDLPSTLLVPPSAATGLTYSQLLGYGTVLVAFGALLESIALAVVAGLPGSEEPLRAGRSPVSP